MATTDDTDEATRRGAQQTAQAGTPLEAATVAHRLGRSVIESAHEGIAVYGPDLRYQLWNPCLERMSGKKAVEVIGRHPLDIFPLLGKLGVITRLEQALAGGIPGPLEFTTELEGRSRWFVDTSVPLHDETGRVVGVIATVQDITEQRRAQEMARAHLHLYGFAGDHCLQELLVETVNAAEKLTASKMGFYHFVQPDQRTLSLQAWSTQTTQTFCMAVAAGTLCDIDRVGVWADGIRERGPVIHNDYASLPHRKGIPDGHARVVRELVVPILREGLVVAILGVGNKETDYTQDDVQTIANLANAAWELAQRKRAEEMLVRRQHESEALFAAAKDVLGSDDFVATARKLFDTARTLTDAKTGYVTLLSKDGTSNEVLFFEANGHASTVDPTRPIRSLHERAYRTGRAVVENSFQHSEWATLLPTDHPPLRNVLIAPLNVAGKAVGILALLNKPSDFDREDLRIAEAVGDLAAIALSNQLNVDLLRSSEERFRTLFENAPDPIFMQQGGRFIYVNRALLKLYGAQTANDLIGTEVLARVAPEYHEVVAERIKVQRETRAAVPQREMEHIRLDGTRVPVETTAVALPLRQGIDYLVFLRDISGRRERHRALESSEQKFRNLFAHASIGMFRSRLDGSEILDINDACLKILQGTRAELIGRPSAVHWADPLERAEVTRRLTTELRVTDFECKMLTRAGECRNCLISLALYPDQGILEGSILDITDRKQAEEKLRKSEYFLRTVIESSPNLVYIYDLENRRTLYANQEVARFLGYSSDQILAMGSSLFARILHPEDASAVGEHHTRMATGTHALARIEYRMRHASGEWRWLRSHDVPFSKNADGTVRSILGSTEDVTEERRALANQKESEQRLRQSEARYRSLVEGSIEGIGISSGNRVVYANQALLDIFGYDSLEEFIKVPLLDTVAPAFRSLIGDLMERQTRGEVIPPRFEFQIVRRNGALRDIEISTVLFDVNGEAYTQSTFRDVTERKQAEGERARLEEQLRQAQKMESVGRLAGGVAHDFNNMLAVILGQTELAMEHVDPSEPLHADLQIIRKAAERSAELTRQLLAFARKQTITPRVLDLNETVSGMLKIIRRLIGEDIHLVWLPGQNLGPVKVDPSQLDQILANLCVNARDAIAGTGRLTIETAGVSFDEAYCAQHAGFVAGDYVVLSVCDDGCGMDKDTLGHLFEPFFTTKEVGKGTGLGLATVFGIVRQNNGFIDVLSEPGQGSTFKIHLPRHQHACTQPAEMTAPSAAARNATILLVEDESGMRQVTARMLQRLGYTVVEACTPAEAIRRASEHAGKIDLLVTDVVMPEMNGRDLARQLLSSYPAMKHLFMSGYTADVIAHHGAIDEGLHFLEKPFSMDLLATKLHEVLDPRSLP